jgi:hypothetical protein
MKPRFLARVLSVSMLAGGIAAHAQNLRILSQTGGVSASVLNGGTVTMTADAIGRPVTSTISLFNVGASSLAVAQIGLTGSADFFLLSVPYLPAALATNGLVTFYVQYTPTSSAAASTLSISTTEGGIAQTYSVQLTGSVAGGVAAPNFVASYAEPVTNNAIALPNGGTINFSQVAISDSSSIIVTIVNRGTGSGAVNNISAAGSGFQLLNLPLFPVVLGPSIGLQFTVKFAPAAQQSYSGTLRIDFPSQSWNIQLQGSGVGPTFTYAVVADDSVSEVQPGGIIQFSDTPVGQLGHVALRITNEGSAQGQVSGLTLNNAVFRVSDAPFTPFTVVPGSSVQVTLEFSPTEPGTFSARVLIGGDSFMLSGVGAGARLEYSYGSSDLSNVVVPGDAVVLQPAAVGDSSGVLFTIRNTGNRVAPLFAVALLGGAASAFQLSGVPALPYSLETGSSVTLTLRFMPNNVGALSTSLGVNNSTFSIVGTGMAPSHLPQYQFGGASGIQSPLQQPAISLTLAEPYPLPITGVLTLSFVSDVFGSNPAVQFSTGGRQAAFTIPANTTSAVFDNSQTSIRVQTGTVAGTLVVTPSFATEAGLDLTPPAAESLNLTVNRSGPQVLGAQITSRTLTGFTLTITGYTTTRSLQQLDLQLNARSGIRIGNAHLTVNLQSPALVWFQSTNSESFGGLFSVSLPVLLQGGHTNQDQTAYILSVDVSLSNDVGTSGTVNVPLS